MYVFKIAIFFSILLLFITLLSLILILRKKKRERKKGEILNALAPFIAALVSFLIALCNVSEPEIYPSDSDRIRVSGEQDTVIITSQDGSQYEVYYSLDGTDPRIGGEKYEDSIIISKDTTITARNKFLWWWSKKVERTYHYDSVEEDVVKVETIKRPVYSLQELNEGILGDQITFNSLKYVDTDEEWYYKNTGKRLPLGTLQNETNFVGARVAGVNAGVNNIWEGSKIAAVDGRTYIVRLYVHNNNPNGEAAIAKDTKVRFYIFNDSSDELDVDGWLYSSNANPQVYSDIVTFVSNDGTAFHLEYVPGSALLENGGFASGDGIWLPDSITNQGNETNKVEDEWTLIGYNGLDGMIPGCYEYVCCVAVQVKVVYDREFTVETRVRLAEDRDRTWKDTVEAQVGDRVEFQITYTNTSDLVQSIVKVKDKLPQNLLYVANSTKLITENNPDGIMIPDNVQENIAEAIDIGSYNPNENAKIVFSAEVVDDNLDEGRNSLKNHAEVDIGTKVIFDCAEVIVWNE